MKTNYFEQYKQKKLVGALTPEISHDFYLELKELSKKYIPLLENYTYTEEDIDQLLIMAKLVAVFLPTELKIQEPQYLEMADRVNSLYHECARIMPLYPNAEFFNDIHMGKYIVSIPYDKEVFESKDHNVWALLNFAMWSTKVPQESLFMFYLYLINSEESTEALKKAWAFFQFHKMKITSEKTKK